MTYDYSSFLKGPASKQWKRAGTGRRSGVAVPLFSLYSAESRGIGELPDLKLLVDWCLKADLSIIQLLPMNDVGFSFRPYDSQSSFALDPMYLRLSDIPVPASKKDISKKIKDLPARFPLKAGLDYGIKRAKLEILAEIYSPAFKSAAFDEFCGQNDAWLGPYALYRVLKNRHEEKAWFDWPDEFSRLDKKALAALEKKEKDAVRFQKWLQWHLFIQFLDAKKYAAKKGVLFMGDLPFLVSRDSADVWENQHYFKIDEASGAPPDLCFSRGQKWGMPPYDWKEIEKDSFSYIKRKLGYSAYFYDLFRIDHFVGLFRLWTFPSGSDKGAFDPKDEAAWEDHGKKILDAMLAATAMLPCAEDLGTVPDCSYKVLKEYGLPGMDVVRWTKKGRDFKPAGEYRPNSITVISTHDLTSLAAWWEFEAETVDEASFRAKCEHHGIPFDALRHELFELEHSRNGRLRWRRDVHSKDALLSRLAKPEWQVGDLIALHEETFNERWIFSRHVGFEGDLPLKMTPELARKILEFAAKTASIFNVQLLQDWYALGGLESTDAWSFRINFPGTTQDSNWSMRMPFGLEEMLEAPILPVIREINKAADRQ